MPHGKGITEASLGAVTKGTNDDGTPVARVVFDGTHGASINQAMKVRDQGAAPREPDVKRAMKDKADVQAASRRIGDTSVAEWRRMAACTYKRSGRSAWGAPPTAGNGRPARSLRLAQYIVSTHALFWLHVMADDSDIEAAADF